ncbi:hypothetical protein E2C01_084746 [Portunus trituberculatus]|uniref:Uncharacterized protein n=1 Tax=Portunus trituberculatus TaxID=210409 RepID=A0A5B7J721_PORTR|nr:hypothetical protein [Portunus trituberculatus]
MERRGEGKDGGKDGEEDMDEEEGKDRKKSENKDRDKDREREVRVGEEVKAQSNKFTSTSRGRKEGIRGPNSAQLIQCLQMDV